MRNPNDILIDRIAEKLKNLEFPEDKLDLGFKQALRKALLSNSVSRCKCTMETWEKYVKFHKPFNFLEIGLAIEILKSSTPNEMQMSLDEHYCMLMNVVEPLYQFYNKKYKDVVSKEKEKIETQMKISMPNGGLHVR